jgi:hypothetical protein
MSLPRVLLLGWLMPWAVALSAVDAAAPKKRQYYAEEWQRSEKGTFYFKKYYSRPKTSAPSYQVQFMVYRPQKSQHWIYWYNPKAKKYWARCATRHHPKYGDQVKKGKAFWSLVRADRRQPVLAKIGKGDYGQVTGAPPIPGSRNGPPIAPPPPDLPDEEE